MMLRRTQYLKVHGTEDETGGDDISLLGAGQHTVSLRDQCRTRTVQTFLCGHQALAVTSAVHFGHFGCLCVLLLSRRCHRLSPPLPQALHLTGLQLGQVLLLHVHPAQLGAEDVVGNVLLLLGL